MSVELLTFKGKGVREPCMDSQQRVPTKDPQIEAKGGPIYVSAKTNPPIFEKFLRNILQHKICVKKTCEKFGGFVLENRNPPGGVLRAESGFCHEIGLVSGEEATGR